MLKLVLALITFLVLVVVLIRFAETSFAFFPVGGETTNATHFGVPHRQLSISTSDGEQLRAWDLAHPAPHARVLYFHGNGGNLSIWAPILAGIARQGYSVLAFDYRGYGGSTGRPTERGLYRDV